jgi:uncharacterized protein (DUF488 family)
LSDAAPHPFFTIGHSTRPIPDFVELLRAADVGLLVDVRTVPRSRTNQQYNRDTLPATLSRLGLGYEHIAALGGLRPKSKTVPPQLNAFWRIQSFHNYADYALSEAFRAGLAELHARGREQRCAIMCAESVWWRCHRRIITDYLLAAGGAVFHIMAAGRIEPARMTPAARVRADESLVYPADAADEA